MFENHILNKIMLWKKNHGFKSQKSRDEEKIIDKPAIKEMVRDLFKNSI